MRYKKSDMGRSDDDITSDDNHSSGKIDAMDSSDQVVNQYRKRGRLTKRGSRTPSDSNNDHDEDLAKSVEAEELQSQTSDENDHESEIEEEDVKVCDICGDAGREDLLAVCSRCTDGAEHTYCMRKMLDKVPDGDWLCEECKYNEEMEERNKLEHSKIHGLNERSRLLRRTSSVNDDFVKSDGSKAKIVSQKKQVPSKRPSDSFEAGPASKKQAVESSLGSPTASSSGRPTTSKDNRSLDKMKGKSLNKISTGIESTGDSSEAMRSPTTSSLNASKGNFTKSNSFSTGNNSKLNSKFPDEIQKKKHGIEAKDVPGKLITKSMSFKGLGRSNVSEPKVKMLSPNFAPEFKGPKQGRERISLERKNTMKMDQSTSDQMTTITPKHPSSLSVTNNRDIKNCQPDGKLTTLPKHSHKQSEATDNTGEVKRQSSTSVSGSVPVNGTTEARPNPVSITELPRTADRSVIDDNGAKADVQDNQNEKTVENSLGRSRQGANGGVAGGNRRELSTDLSITRTKDSLHKENNLKAAIEAAMQKKQDMFRKNRNVDKLNELSTSNSQGNYVGVPVSNVPSDPSSEGMVDGDATLRSNSCKSASGGNFKQVNVCPAAGCPVLTVSAIPEQESIWQGGFEIHRNGKFPDMCGGFQAHLSSIAAGKVGELAKKFPQKIVMDEVPRPCVWPMKFKEVGAQEDNVALYFFAKDSESYLRSYKMLVDYLMKHDLALRGHFNEVELLVFPSNHLPDKSQCWNAFFFMWGVFRGRRPDNRCGVQETAEIRMSNAIPQSKDVTSTPYDGEARLHRRAVKDISGNLVGPRCDVPASVRSPATLSNGGDRNCLTSHPLRGPTHIFSRSGVETAALNDPKDEGPVKCVNKIDEGQQKQETSSSSSHCLVHGQAGGGLVVGSESSSNPANINKDEEVDVDEQKKLKVEQRYVDINICVDNDEVQEEDSSNSEKRTDPLDDDRRRRRRKRGGNDLDDDDDDEVEKTGSSASDGRRFLFLDESPNLELALGVEKKQQPRSSSDIIAGTSSKEEEDAAAASLSLSLAFPFSDNGRMAASPASGGQVDPAAHDEINTSLLLFRGSRSCSPN